MLRWCEPILVVAVSVFLGAVTYFPQQSNTVPPPSQQAVIQPAEQGATPKPHAKKSVVYANKTYRFTFSLPDSWKGYSVLVGEWSGGVYQDDGTSQPARMERGPEITIRHPLWTEENPRQDIPIMVFTLAQWRLVDEGTLITSAAPVGPSEVGRNAKFVFALPARYTMATPTGSQEVWEIMERHPLHPF